MSLACVLDPQCSTCSLLVKSGALATLPKHLRRTLGLLPAPEVYLPKRESKQRWKAHKVNIRRDQKTSMKALEESDTALVPFRVNE